MTWWKYCCKSWGYIGNNIVIDSGSVVTKDIPDNAIAVGNSCKIIRKITVGFMTDNYYCQLINMIKL